MQDGGRNMKIPTIKDVALKAGVSTATVSRYLNNQRYVSEEVQIKLCEIIEELDFVPNHVARSLKTTSTKTIGIVIPDLSNVSFMDTVKGISDVAIENDYQPFILSSEEDAEKENKILDVLVSKRVDGILIASSADSGEKILKINNRNLPVVLLDRDVCNSDDDILVDAILNDNFNGSYKMVNYLISLGHKKIAIISSCKSRMLTNERLKGYIKALEDNNMPVNLNYILYGDSKFKSGYDLTKKLIMQPMNPTAIYTVNNIMALGAVSALNEMNITIPDKISICAFGEFKYHTVLKPDLTVINQHPYDMGKKAAEVLMKKIQNSQNWKPERILIEGDIIMRDSCARPY
jgi:LacI family transcriptional regulator